MAEAISLDAILSSIPDANQWKLDREIDFEHKDARGQVIPQHLGRIAEPMVDWEGAIADHLGLSEADRRDIRYKNSGQPAKQRREALNVWKSRLGSRATYRALIEVFFKAGRLDYADAVCSILQDITSVQETRPNFDELVVQGKELDAKMAELFAKDKEWEESERKIFQLEGNWQSKRLEWEENQKKRQEIMKAYEGIVEGQRRQLRNYTLGLSSLLDGMNALLKEIQKAAATTAAADNDLQYGRQAKDKLVRLTGHLGNLEDQHTYLKTFREELLERRKGLEQSLKKLNELKAISDECNRDIQECGKALAKCDTGLEECKTRIQKVKERLEEVERERAKIVEEVSYCEVRLRSSTTDLEKCQAGVKDCIGKLRGRSLELDASIVNAATGMGAAAGIVAGGGTVALAGGAFASVGIALSVLSGGALAPVVGAAALAGAGGGGVLGGLFGHHRGNNIKRDNEEKRRKLEYCLYDLEKCDDIIKCLHMIVNECREEIEHMKEIIGVRIMYHSK